MNLDPRLKKLLAFGLLGSGALAVMSAAVNIYGAYQLIEPSDAESLGVSRGEIIGTYGVIFLAGLGLLLAGWRLRK